MVPEVEKPRVTEIKVRMDCNGCVQKIKKALHGVIGIHELYIDFPQQKITIIGWADPEKIVKAIKKTRKTAIICSHTEPPDPAAQQSESTTQVEAPAPESANPPSSESANPPSSETANPPSTESPPAETAPPAEPPKDSPPQENPKPEAKSSPDTAKASASQPVQPAGLKDFEEVHVIYHHPPDYGYRYGYNHNVGHGYGGEWHSYPSGPGFRPAPPPPVDVTHSYNTHRPSPYVTGYESVRPPPQYTNYNQSYSTHRPSPSVTGYESVRPPPQYTNYNQSYNTHRPSPSVTGYESVRPPPQYTNYDQSYNTRRPSPSVTGYEYTRSPQQYPNYNMISQYSEDYYNGSTRNGNITSVFSDENPNACRIV